MGHLTGHRQVTLYIDPVLYEKMRCTAYALGEDIYEMVDEAMKSAIDRRLTQVQRATIESMAEQNIKNLAEKKGKTRDDKTKRAKRG
jgi:hypothetical protein